MFGTLVSPKLRSAQLSFETGTKPDTVSHQDKQISLSLSFHVLTPLYLCYLYTSLDFDFNLSRGKEMTHSKNCYHAALETLIEIANMRSTMFSTSDQIRKEMAGSKG